VALIIRTAVDRIWARDVIAIPLQKGFLMLVAGVYLFSRNLLGRKFAGNLDREFRLGDQEMDWRVVVARDLPPRERLAVQIFSVCGQAAGCSDQDQLVREETLS
jgi:hypothetical protein